jgi:hypothetical protein
MPNNDIEAFEYVVSDKETAVEIDYLTYAMFAYKKKRWIEHFKERNSGATPTQQQIDGWICELSSFDFEQMRNDAAAFFDESARSYLSEYIKNEKKLAVDQSILREIKTYTDPWRHLVIALGMAILAPLVLGGLVFLYLLFDKTFPVHIIFGNVETPSVSSSSPPSK